MFAYLFDTYIGYDKVVALDPNLPVEVGDLVIDGGKFALILGDDVSFIERYTHPRLLNPGRSVLIKGFFAPTTLEMIHWMVAERYTTYHKVIPLYFPPGRDKQVHLYTENLAKRPKYRQTLFLFPDVWTLRNMTTDADRDHRDNLVLTSKSTPRSLIAAMDDIRRCVVEKVYATRSEIFQDRRNL